MSIGKSKEFERDGTPLKEGPKANLERSEHWNILGASPEYVF